LFYMSLSMFERLLVWLCWSVTKKGSAYCVFLRSGGHGGYCGHQPCAGGLTLSLVLIFVTRLLRSVPVLLLGRRPLLGVLLFFWWADS